MPEEALMIVGTLKAIFFQNPSNFYKVLLIKVKETNTDYNEAEIVVTGSIGDVQEDEAYRFFGHFVDHPRYGRQFAVERYEQAQPTSVNGVVNYLASDKFPGIGKKTAEKIVEVLGEGAIDHIVEDPAVLAQVPGLNNQKRELLIKTIQENYGMEKVIVGLSDYGFGAQLSFAIYQRYRNQSLDVIHENPYQLVEDVEGIGFKKADSLAEQLGIAADSRQRIRAAIIHQVTEDANQSGDTYVEAQVLLEEVMQLLESTRPVAITPEQIADAIIELVEEEKIAQEETKIYERTLFYSEWGIGTSIARLLERKKEINYPAEKVEKKLRVIEKRLGITYGDSQDQAIKDAITSPLFILTGGPGTGKTTVVNGIVQLFAELNDLSLDPSDYTQKIFPILLAAPTGRAAKRMNETTGLPASTIHRLLGLNGHDKTPDVEARELDGGLLIVDEMSMVDTWLANTLLKSIPTNMQVILVGDKDQLPSVGPGQVFHDLLEVDAIPQSELTEIYRQGDDSSIIPLAHEIKEGQLPADFRQNKKDRSFIACHANQMEQVIAQIVEKAKSKGFSAQDVQVLAPMYRGPAGIDALNKMMQEIFNPNDGTKKEVSWNDQVYRIGDKVLQLVNDAEDNVFNGDMGIITGIIPAKQSDEKVDELVIQFDATEVSYKRSEWNKIKLSYCCSIHKAQGSEFQMVLLPMVRQYSRMLQRNLLYTAVTRSKDLLILLGEEAAFSECVTHEAATRQTTLIERIATACDLPELVVKEPASEPFAKSRDAVSESAEKVEELPATDSKEQPIAESDVITETAPVYQTTKRGAKNVPTGPQVLTPQLVLQQTIDPMIGMDGVSPQNFM